MQLGNLHLHIGREMGVKLATTYLLRIIGSCELIT